jgi:hypothetical protein
MNENDSGARRQMVLIAVVGTLLALGAIAWATGELPGQERATQRDQTSPSESSEPPRLSALPSAVVEDCNRYAAAARRDAGRVAGEAVVGGGIGAGVGAVGGAIAGGHEAPKQGAGIGAIVGATAGTLHGLREESRRTEAARAAYAECMARGGYSG